MTLPSNHPDFVETFHVPTQLYWDWPIMGHTSHPDHVLANALRGVLRSTVMYSMWFFEYRYMLEALDDGVCV